MSSWAKPGAKCVCQKDVWPDQEYGEVVPWRGQLLTIRTVELVDGILALTFVEIVNQPKQYVEGFFECCFSIRWFRPVVGAADDIALFAHHLSRVGEPA